eukprot:COSAG01_NODE_1887_length_8982_cov_15.771474_5_plen_675_part_00
MPQVCDFGVATVVQHSMASMSGGGALAGTLAWMAPETFKGEYTAGSDCFALGVIDYELLTRQEPWSGLGAPEIIKKASATFVVNEHMVTQFNISAQQQEALWTSQNPLQDRRPDLSAVEAGCPSELVALLQRCWADSPQERPTMQQRLDDMLRVLVRLQPSEAPEPSCLPGIQPEPEPEPEPELQLQLGLGPTPSGAAPTPTGPTAAAMMEPEPEATEPWVASATPSFYISSLVVATKKTLLPVPEPEPEPEPEAKAFEKAKAAPVVDNGMADMFSSMAMMGEPAASAPWLTPGFDGAPAAAAPATFAAGQAAPAKILSPAGGGGLFGSDSDNVSAFGGPAPAPAPKAKAKAKAKAGGLFGSDDSDSGSDSNSSSCEGSSFEESSAPSSTAPSNSVVPVAKSGGGGLLQPQPQPQPQPLQDAASKARANPHWVPDSQVTACMQCTKTFGWLQKKRHHCRHCGWVVCGNCSRRKLYLTQTTMPGQPPSANGAGPQRVCDNCFKHIELRRKQEAERERRKQLLRKQAEQLLREEAEAAAREALLKVPKCRSKWHTCICSYGCKCLHCRKPMPTGIRFDSNKRQCTEKIKRWVGYPPHEYFSIYGDIYGNRTEFTVPGYYTIYPTCELFASANALNDQQRQAREVQDESERQKLHYNRLAREKRKQQLLREDPRIFD